MVLRTLPIEIEQHVYAGTDFYKQYRWLPDGQNPQDFTGWSATWLIGTAGTATHELGSGTGEVGLASTGVITLHLDPTFTAALTGTSMSYTLDLTDPGTGYVMRFMRGRLTIVHDLEIASP